MKKEDLVKKYYEKRRLNTDIYSDTYRWWLDDYIYEPFSFDEILKEWKEYLSTDNKKIIDFYIHIPFCFTKCKYCDYYKEIVSWEKINNYLDFIYSYLEEYKEVFKWIKFRGLYIWWWTPSILKKEQIDELLEYIFNNFSFDENWEKTFEVNPINLTLEKIKVLKKHWINRISMWIQSLDPKVLKNENRFYQKEEIVENVLKNLLDNWFENINWDIMMGLTEDNVDSIDYTVKKMISWWFSNIVLYRFLPTDEYLKEHYNWQLEKYYKTILPKINLYYDLINKKIKSWDYKIENSNLLLENWYRWDLIIKNYNYKKYDDFSEASLFWVGASSRSHIFWKIYYKTIDNLDISIDKIIFEWRKISIEDEKSLFAITNSTNQEKIDILKYKNIFNSEFEEDFKDYIEILKEKNYFKKDKNNLYFNIGVKEKNYYSLFCLKDEELKKRISFLDNNLDLIILFNNSLKIWLKFDINNIPTYYNFYQINKNTISFYYKINKIMKAINKEVANLWPKNKNKIFIKLLLLKLKKEIKAVKIK